MLKRLFLNKYCWKLVLQYLQLIVLILFSNTSTTIGQNYSLADTTSNWSKRSKLPLLIAEKLKVETEIPRLKSKNEYISYYDSTIINQEGKPVLDSMEAQRISIEFISRIFPSYAKHLVLSSIRLSKTGWPPEIDSDSLLIVTFETIWNGMKIYHSGANIYLLGSKVRSADFYLWEITGTVPDSERPIIPADSAINIWKNTIAKYLNITMEPEFIELQYYFFPMDNLDFNPDRYILRPHWVFDSSDLVVDAFEGKFWRND